MANPYIILGNRPPSMSTMRHQTGSKADELAAPRERKTDFAGDDEIKQAQHKLSGLCIDCGGPEAKEKYANRCYPCFVHYKVHT